MHMLMVVFRESLKERVHELLEQCDIKAFTEVNETVGYARPARPKGWPFTPERIPSSRSLWTLIMWDG